MVRDPRSKQDCERNAPCVIILQLRIISRPLRSHSTRVLSLLTLTYHLGVGEPDVVFLTDPGENEASGPRAATKPTSTLMPSQIGANLQVAAYSSEIAERHGQTLQAFGDPSLLSQFRENQPAEESKPELAFSIPDRVHCLL